MNNKFTYSRLVFFGEQGPDNIKSQANDKAETSNDSNIDDPDSQENRELADQFKMENGERCTKVHTVGSVTYEYTFTSNPDNTVTIKKKNVSPGAENEPVHERKVTYQRLYENKIPGMKEIAAVLAGENFTAITPESEKSKNNIGKSQNPEKLTKEEIITDPDILMGQYNKLLSDATNAYEAMPWEKFTGAYATEADFVGSVLASIEGGLKEYNQNHPNNVNMEIVSTVRGISISNKREIPFVKPDGIADFRNWTDSIWKKNARDSAGFH
jgi:hypothetical protein